MKKIGLIILTLVMIALLMPIVVDAKAEKISKNLMSLSENQETRVVVRFKEDISEIQGLLSVKNEEIPAEKIKYKSGKSVFALLTKQEIDRLALSDSIEYISEEKKYHTLLQDSVPLINATSSWKLQSSGVNLTGEGQTICIIDTGVNYSHPDLGGCFGENNVSSTCKVIGGRDFCADDYNCMTEDEYPMDVEGHGTHVAGIAAANGGINGTAPYSKIVMIKAGNATGTFWDLELKKAIDWCINNASKFNISVISMSLGGGLYDNYCDEYSDGDNFPPMIGDSVNLVSSINLAISQNISVIAASGNENSVTHIASPACIQNVTPIAGNIFKNQAVYNGFSRNFLVKLVAPGININSTIKTGLYASWDGTSMATPHAAGAIAIINQYLKSVGQTRTPQQIEDLLNTTGKQIYDSAAGRFFSRIDVYSALMEIDTTAPNVTLFLPINNSIDIRENQTFVCNASDWQLANVTFYLWNSTGIYYNETKNITGNLNSTSFNKTEMISGNYKWNCLASDVKGNSNFSALNFSITIGGISLSIVEPANNTYTNINETYFNCSATSSSDRQIKNITFFIYENETLEYSSSVNLMGTINSSLFSFNLTNETRYTWGCEVYSNESDYEVKNYTITYDITYPKITFNEEIVTTNQATLSWNTSEISNYSFNLNGANYTNSSFYLNYSLIISGLSASTNYNYNISYCDMAGNCNLTEESFRTLDVPVIRSSGGGGGGGGSTPVKINETQLSQGYNKKYSWGEKISFVLREQNHSLQLNKILNETVNITIRSEPITLIMQNGEEKKFNLTSSEYYDLYIKVENMTKYSANITIKGIEELINPHKIIKYENETQNETDKGKRYETSEDKKEPIERDLAPLYATLVLLICAFFYFLLRGRLVGKKEENKNKKE